MSPMIVYELPEEFVMVEQHHHALLSGAFAELWGEASFLSDDRRTSVLQAISQHDRAWIDIDESPLWNDETRQPYSFMDYPLVPKLTFYKKGIDELEVQNPYGALLASLHYCSFFAGATNERALAFTMAEEERQTRLKLQLQIDTEAKLEQLRYNFKLLQFCDDLSLYVCMQKPGVSKDEEIDWFKNGFKQIFDFMGGKKLVAAWKDQHCLQFNRFPFRNEGTVELRLKAVPKCLIQSHGMIKAYNSTPYTLQSIDLVK